MTADAFSVREPIETGFECTAAFWARPLGIARTGGGAIVSAECGGVLLSETQG